MSVWMLALFDVVVKLFGIHLCKCGAVQLRFGLVFKIFSSYAARSACDFGM